jgi:hypothetical protein
MEFSCPEYKLYKSTVVQNKVDFTKYLTERENLLMNHISVNCNKVSKPQSHFVSLPLRFIRHSKHQALFYLNSDALVVLSICKHNKPDVKCQMWKDYTDLLEKHLFVFHDLVMDKMSDSVEVVEHTKFTNMSDSETTS